MSKKIKGDDSDSDTDSLTSFSDDENRNLDDDVDPELLKKFMTRIDKQLPLTESAFKDKDEPPEEDPLNFKYDPRQPLNPLQGIPYPDVRKVIPKFTRGRARMVEKIKIDLDAARRNREKMLKQQRNAPKELVGKEGMYDEDNLDEIQYTREESLKSAWKDLYSSCPVDTKAFVLCHDAIGLKNCERSLMSLSQCAAIEHCFHGWQSMMQNCSKGWAQNYSFHCQDSKAAVFACFSEYGFPEILQRAIIHHVQTDPTGRRRQKAIAMGYTPEEIDSNEAWEGPDPDRFTVDVSELRREIDEEDQATRVEKKIDDENDQDSLD